MRKLISDFVRLSVTSAEPEGFLRTMSDNGFVLHDIKIDSPLETTFTVSRSSLPYIRAYCQKYGLPYRILYETGMVSLWQKLIKRGVLITGIFFLFLLTIFLPTKILFYEMKGLNRIPEDCIIQQLERMGIRFGCSKNSINKTQICNTLIQSIPQVHWVGIQTSGCVMTVEIQETTIEQQQQSQSGSVAHLIANTDGVVESITVLQGSGLCQPGQAVVQGQILISGYEDHGLYLRATKAEGEIYAKTYHVLNCISPLASTVRQEFIAEDKKLSVLFGKKQIKLYNCSGISPATCVKMYSRKYVTLPGGFQLPIAIVTEYTGYYETAETRLTKSTHSEIEKYCQMYLKDQMIAGRILDAKLYPSVTENRIILSCHYICHEQIGKIKTEEILN